mmetsp:Transcript_40950/g.73347  ORF Transcript_40950/g.73347 Transcript_40950/m.73347 type:complete len:295 (-) Transcript_40950:76-960(-)
MLKCPVRDGSEWCHQKAIQTIVDTARGSQCGARTASSRLLPGPPVPILIGSRTHDIAAEVKKVTCHLNVLYTNKFVLRTEGIVDILLVVHPAILVESPESPVDPLAFKNHLATHNLLPYRIFIHTPLHKLATPSVKATVAAVKNWIQLYEIADGDHDIDGTSSPNGRLQFLSLKAVNQFLHSIPSPDAQARLRRRFLKTFFRERDKVWLKPRAEHDCFLCGSSSTKAAELICQNLIAKRVINELISPDSDSEDEGKGGLLGGLGCPLPAASSNTEGYAADHVEDDDSALVGTKF